MLINEIRLTCQTLVIMIMKKYRLFSEEELLPPARGEEFRQLRSFASAGLSVTAMEKDDGREDADLIC